MNTRTILVDADIVAFQIAAACQRVVRWEWGIWSQWADEVEAEKAMEDYLESLIIDLGADEMIICLTDDENFRKSILPTYKANRDNVPRPYLLKHLKEVMERDYTKARD